MARLSLIVIALLACWAVDVRCEDAETAWEHHQAHFPITAASPAEREKRRSLFMATHEYIESHNKKNLSYTMGHSRFSTMTKEEKEKYLGLRMEEVPSHSRRTFVTAEQISSTRVLPFRVDLRTHKCMNSVKDQGPCGSCWAFSATAPVEFGTCLKNNGNKVVLSEQQIVDCSPGYGCNGGMYYAAWAHIAKVGGQDTSASYPYTASRGSCRFNSAGVGGKVSWYDGYYARDVTSMMTALSENRLLSISFNVVDSFHNYRSGVYDETACSTSGGNHAMVIVGYGISNALNHWIVRNSWGSSWGDSGYALIRRGVNTCGIEGTPAFPTFPA